MSKMHKFENQKQAIRLNRGEVFAFLDGDLRNAEFFGSSQRLMEEGIRFLAALLWFEEIRFVKKLRVNLDLLNEIRDLNRVGGFDLHLLEVFIAQRDPFALLVFETFDDLVGRDLLLIGLGDLLITNRAQVSFS